MLLSVITPLHQPGNQFVRQAYESLRRQKTQAAWQWVVVENHGGTMPEDIAQDEHVVILRSDAEGIGALKLLACERAVGEVLVELDADDELAPNALDRVAQAFARDEPDMVYSDFAEFREGPGGRRTSRSPGYPYDSAFGWTHYGTEIEGQNYIAMRGAPPTAHNLRQVEWAPNHLRAWSQKAYRDVGGHDPDLAVCDDHDLSIRMFLAKKKIQHIESCLYLYRVHDENTVRTQNAAIAAASWRNYERYVWSLAARWTEDKGLAKVDLCGAHDAPVGFEVLDQEVAPYPNLEQRWPIEDSSVGLLRAEDAIEHLADPVHTMNEAYRVLAPGGWLMVSVPSTTGLGAFCDPTHKSYWNKLSFRYYTDRAFSRYVPKFVGRFQQLRLLDWYPSDWHKTENVPYVECNLVCLKPGYEPMGEVRI